MAVTYFKRYRMEIDLVGRDLYWPRLPEGYAVLPWDASLLEAHSEVKYLSFRDEIDANIFPCFNELSGCRRLMGEIRRKAGFLPEATWLAVWTGLDGADHDHCGTVQGIKDLSGLGAIQNLGITPPHRGRGVGTYLLFRALRGFRQAGLDRVFLEVTADNEGAIRLYRRLGFQVVKTVYKAAEVACS
jgi:ribosomal protein S18 acetylase RimI-like enzyme